MAIPVRPAALRAWLRSPTGRTMLKYSMVSVVSATVGQLTLAFTYGVLKLGSAVLCNLIACITGGIPAYSLNRAWSWGKRGRSSLRGELLPFALMTLAGLALSTGLVALAEDWALDAELSHAVTTAVVNAASLGGFGLVWIGKFVVLNRLLFVVREDATPPE